MAQKLFQSKGAKKIQNEKESQNKNSLKKSKTQDQLLFHARAQEMRSLERPAVHE